MRKNRLELKTGEDFELEVFFKDRRADGKSFDVNLEGSTIGLDIVYYNTDNERVERLFDEALIDTTNSILRNGYISCKILGTDTNTIPDYVTRADFNLWLSDKGSFIDVASGTIRVIQWTPFVEPVG